MNKGCKYYKFTFIININTNYKLICGGLYAKDRNKALNKLPDAIQKRIGGITEHLSCIKMYNKERLLIYFTNWEDMIHEISIA